MNKLQTIKAMQLQARKDRDTFTATLLTTLIGEAEMVGKNDGNREVTDSDVNKILKKFEDGLVEMINLCSEPHLAVKGLAAQSELTIIRKFLPQKLDNDLVRNNIVSIMIANDLKYEQRSMGIISKELKVLFTDQYDGAQVSRIFKDMLANAS